jgi:DNA polymerase I
MSNLLEGIDPTEGIVGLHVAEDHILRWRREANDTIKERLPLQLWTLSRTEGLLSRSGCLTGDLPFKHAYAFGRKKVWERFNRDFRDDGLFTYRDPVKNIMVANGTRQYKGLDLKDLTLLGFDIETTGLDPYASDALVILITNTVVHPDGRLERKMFSVDEYTHQGEMIAAWGEWVQEINPDVLIGHNIFCFDLPYLAACAQRFGIGLCLGRDGMEMTREVQERKFRLDMGRHLQFRMPQAPGREFVDTLLLAYKFDVGKKWESYGLKYLVKTEGLEGEGRVFYDAAKIRENYRKPSEMIKIKAYAERDADDALNLFKKIGTTFFQMTRFLPMSLSEICVSASGGQIDALLVSSYLSQGHSIPETSEKRKFQGAISDGWPGVYRNVLKFDVSSLYPSIILSFDVYDKTKDPQGLVLAYTRDFREMRLKFKKAYKETGDESWDALDKVAKGFLNSFYGFFGTKGLQFNSPACAEFITRTGREILEKSIVWATGKEYIWWKELKGKPETAE